MLHFFLFIYLQIITTLLAVYKLTGRIFAPAPFLRYIAGSRIYFLVMFFLSLFLFEFFIFIFVTASHIFGMKNKVSIYLSH